MLHEDERIGQLYAEDTKIIQSSKVFSFSLDAVLLAHFSRVPKKGKIVDLCVGSDAVRLFLSKRTQAAIDAIKFQPRLADTARCNIALSHLNEQVIAYTIDLKDSLSVVRHNSYDLVACNLPYFRGLPTNKTNLNKYLAIARREIHTTLEKVIDISNRLLKIDGRFTMVHRSDRFLETIQVMEDHRTAPKRIQSVYPKSGKEANVLLVGGTKEGKLDGFKVAPPLVTYNMDGEYTAETREMLYDK